MGIKKRTRLAKPRNQKGTEQMNITAFNIPCYPCDKEMFPGNQSSFEHRESTTFFNDFKIAEKFGGLKAVKDTFRRAFSNWKDSIGYITELSVVMNNLGWMHYKKDEMLSKFYFDSYDKCVSYVYSDDNDDKFSEEDRILFHAVLD